MALALFRFIPFFNDEGLVTVQAGHLCLIPSPDEFIPNRDLHSLIQTSDRHTPAVSEKPRHLCILAWSQSRSSSHTLVPTFSVKRNMATPFSCWKGDHRREGAPWLHTVLVDKAGIDGK